MKQETEEDMLDLQRSLPEILQGKNAGGGNTNAVEAGS